MNEKLDDFPTTGREDERLICSCSKCPSTYWKEEKLCEKKRDFFPPAHPDPLSVSPHE